MRMRILSSALLAVAIGTLSLGCAAPSTDTHADGEKMVCTREATTGSLRPTSTCRSVAQIERERDQAQKDMNFVRQDAGAAPPDRIGR